MTSVRIVGDGVAARCCAHLLAATIETGYRPRVPVIMIGEAAQRLIADIFDRQDVFRDLPRIQKRIVAWGENASAVELDHSSVLISEEVLLNRLGAPVVEPSEHPGWTIYSAAPLPEAVAQANFGSRMASATPVEMTTDAQADSCWIESLENGWLFLVSGWLLAVGGSPKELLAASKLVAKQIARCEPAKAQFPASPRMVSPLGGSDWIACGSAAMAFDPLCGDGTAHAVREAILASAVIRSGHDPRLLAHFEARLTAGFEKHLIQCHQFYSTGGNSAWWKEQVAATEAGILWCRRKLANHGPFRYRLNGLTLEDV